MSERKARALRAIGKDRKSLRAMGAKALEEHIAQLEAAVNYNGKAAVQAVEAYRQMSWAYFWSQVAIAALLQHLENNLLANDPNDPVPPSSLVSVVSYHDIEKAVLFIPPPGEEGPQI